MRGGDWKSFPLKHDEFQPDNEVFNRYSVSYLRQMFDTESGGLSENEIKKLILQFEAMGTGKNDGKNRIIVYNGESLHKENIGKFLTLVNKITSKKKDGTYLYYEPLYTVDISVDI